MTAKRSRANGEGSIFPYRNGFAAYAWVDKPDGKRARKYVYGQTREAVHEKWIALQSRARTGPVATKVPTVGEYAGYWLREVVEPNLAPGSYDTYSGMCRRHIVPDIGRKRIDKLQVSDVQTWLNGLRHACQCCGQGKDARRRPDKRRCCAIGRCCHQVTSAGTIAHVRRILRVILSQAITDGLITRNVAAHAKLPTIRKRRRPSWTSEQARQFLASARDDGDRYYAAYVLILVLGLRKGELLGLAWEDVDLDSGELTLTWQLQRIGKKLIRRETKTDASDAVIPMPEICVTALRELYESTKDQEVFVGSDWAGKRPIFTTGLGTPVEPRNFNRRWDSRIKAAGVPRITVHGARRTCGSLLVDLDVHPRVAMQILRHAQFAITMEIYSQASSEATREALKKLGASLN